MIVVDSSVWIAHFRDAATPAVAALRGVSDPNDIIVGDLILMECLQGAIDERHAARIETALAQFTPAQMLDPQLAVEAARNYRRLRGLGLTPRKTIDLIIGTYCIQHGHRLLHQDQDFAPMAAHLGLMCVL